MTKEEIESILKPGITIADLKPDLLSQEKLDAIMKAIREDDEQENNKPIPWSKEAWIDLHRPMSI